MPTYRIITKAGSKGPFTLRVILRGLETGKIPKTATLEEVETGRQIKAAEVLGETSSEPIVEHATGSSTKSTSTSAPLELLESDLDPLPSFRPTQQPLGDVHSLSGAGSPQTEKYTTAPSWFSPGSSTVLAAAVVAVVSLFLSWVDLGLLSSSGWQQKAWLALLGFAYPVYGVVKRNMKPGIAYVSLTLMIAALITYQQTKDIELLGNTNINVAGNGFYLYLLASLAACAGVFRYESELIKRLGLPRLPLSTVVGAFLAILLPPVGLGFSIHGAVESRRRQRGLGLSLFGIVVSTLCMGLIIFVVIREYTSVGKVALSNDEQSSESRAEPMNEVGPSHPREATTMSPQEFFSYTNEQWIGYRNLKEGGASLADIVRRESELTEDLRRTQVMVRVVDVVEHVKDKGPEIIVKVGWLPRFGTEGSGKIYNAMTGEPISAPMLPFIYPRDDLLDSNPGLTHMRDEGVLHLFAEFGDQWAEEDVEGVWNRYIPFERAYHIAKGSLLVLELRFMEAAPERALMWSEGNSRALRKYPKSFIGVTVRFVTDSPTVLPKD